MGTKQIKERWLPVVGYGPVIEGRYKVSDQGHVLNVKSGKLLKQQDHNGYRSVFLGTPTSSIPHSKRTQNHHLPYSPKKVQKLVTVHQLVLAAFAGPCPDGQESRHFPDRDPANNNLSNLSYATHDVNMADKLVHGTMKLTKEQRRLAVEQALKAPRGTRAAIAASFGISLNYLKMLVRYSKPRVNQCKDCGIDIPKYHQNYSRCRPCRRIRALAKEQVIGESVKPGSRSTGARSALQRFLAAGQSRSAKSA